MSNSPLPLPKRLLVLSISLAALLPSATYAAITESIGSNVIESPAFIIDHHENDEDPITIRNGLKTNINITISRLTTDPFIVSNYRIAYQLLDKDGVPVKLANADPEIDAFTGVSEPVPVSLTGAAPGPGSTTFNQDIAIYPDPISTLDNNQSYRVVASLQRKPIFITTWSDIADSELPSAQSPVHHYTQLVSGDRDWNVIATAQELSWDRSHILQTDQDAGSFEVSVDITIGRYDDWNEPIAPQKQVEVIIDYDLIEESTGNEVALKNNGQVSARVSLWQFSTVSSGGIRQKIPNFQSINNTADLIPLQQINSSNKHILRCTVRHVENAFGGLKVDTIQQLDPEGLLHFNGILLFGTNTTKFQRFASVPSYGATGTDADGNDFVFSLIQIANGQGILPGSNKYVFGNESGLIVSLMNNGIAVVTLGAEEAYNPDAPGTPVTQVAENMTYTFGPVVMNREGIVTDSISIDLPQGHIFLPDTNLSSHHGESTILHEDVITLNEAVVLQSALEIDLPVNAAIVDESHPLVFATSSLTITPSGQLQYSNVTSAKYIHADALKDLEEDKNLNLIEALDSAGRDLSKRASNDQYLRSINAILEDQVTITASKDTSSRISVAISLAAQSFQTHFPSQADISWNGQAQITLKEGIIQDQSSLNGSNKVSIGYHQTCLEKTCPSDVPKVSQTLIPDNATIAITPTGGLYSSGILADQEQLAWGARSDGNGNINPDYPYAHRTGIFGDGDFFAPGYQVYASDNVLLSTSPYKSAGGDNAPGTLLLSGFNGKTPSPEIHYPTEPEYIAGEGHYPGLNFIVENEEAGDGASRIGGNTDDFRYALMDGGASKYYSRCAGIFGRHAAVDDSFDPDMTIYGYKFQINAFQLSFIASQQEKSWIHGSVSVSGHSNFTQDFLGLKLDCNGELESAEIDPEDDSSKNLVYWNSTFIPRSMNFAANNVNNIDCTKSEARTLTMGVTTRVAHIPTDLHGIMGFEADNGNLTTSASGSGIGVNSQFRIPASIAMNPPSEDYGESYSLVPVGKLRFSNPERNPEAVVGQPGGFVTFGATINVPYFQDLQVQVMTSANDNNDAPIHLAPGWQDNNNNTFFTNTDFDPEHTSWPAGEIALAEYKQPTPETADEFLIKANQKLFGLVDLSYPLKWDDGARSFASMKEQTDDLLVINTKHQVDYLDATTTKVSFGVKYDGLPEINLSNMLNGQIDGAAEAISETISAPLKGAIDEAFEEFDNYLADSLDALIDPIVDQAATEILDPIHEALSELHEEAREEGEEWSEFKDQINDSVADNIAALQAQLCKISENIENEAQEAASLTNDLKTALERIITAIDSIIGEVDIIDGTAHFIPAIPNPDVVADAITRGILTKVNGERDIVKNLVESLLEVLVEPEIEAFLTPLITETNSQISENLAALLEDINPALDQISSSLAQVREFLIDVYNGIDAAGGLAEDLQELVNEAKGAAGEFQTIAAKPINRATEFLEEIALANGIDVDAGTDQLNEYLDLFEEFDKDAFVAALKSELKDALISSSFMEQYQFLIRQTLYDLQAKFEQSVASILSQVSTVMKELISDTVGALEDEINPLLGKVNESMGAAEIVGYAEFNGDSLRKVRIDNRMQIKVPDEMELNTFLEIFCYTSEDQASGGECLDSGERAVEVTIGATDVPFDWISDGLRASLNLKMSLTEEDGDTIPNGVGGGFEMTGGTLQFQVFEISEFAVTMAIGSRECYFGGRASASFDSYAVSVGLFFGRTCNSDPLLLVDSEVASVMPSGQLTGAYVYGEIWMPIVNFGCIFNISAGVGTGVGFFLDGADSPVFVGKMYAGVSGEALCVVSIKGEVSMVGIVQDGSFSASGTGRLKGKAGWCPFCVKFNASATITYSNGDWNVDY